MSKARKISLVVLSFVMLLCCCTLLSACESSKGVKDIAISGAPVSIAVYDKSVHGSTTKYEEELLKSFSVTLTYADNSTETFTGLEELNKHKIYLYNFLVTEKGTHVVTVYCGKISTTFEMTVA